MCGESQYPNEYPNLKRRQQDRNNGTKRIKNYMEVELDDFGSPRPEEKPDFAQLASLPPSEKYYTEFCGQQIFIDSSDWRHSKRLQFQIAASYCNFILFGLAEQTVGTLIPKLQDHYHINDIHTSYIFLALTLGYFAMALLSEQFHRALGYKGVSMMGTMCMMSAYLVASLEPPYFVLVIGYVFSGIGFGSLDASLNAWMGNLVDSNQLLGILHGCYGIGCMISPPLITHLVERKKNPWPWNAYYVVLTAVAASCFVFFAVTFRDETPLKFRFQVLLNEERRREQGEGNAESKADQESQDSDASYVHVRVEEYSADKLKGKNQNSEVEDSPNSGNHKHAVSDSTNSGNHKHAVSDSPDTRTSVDYQESTSSASLLGANTHSENHFEYSEPEASDLSASLSSALKSPLVWFFSTIMFLYVGAEVAFGAWLVTFLVRIKLFPYKQASYMATTFWTGLTAGRIGLGFVTAHYFLSELAANWTYIGMSVLGQLLFCVFAFTPATAVLFVVVFVTGLFVGPIFPTTIVCALEILPVKYHATGVGFICAFGGGGGAMLPFLVGLIANQSVLGLRFYPFVILAIYGVLVVAWLVLYYRYRHIKRRLLV